MRPFCYANTKATFMLADRIEDYLSGHVECTALAYTDEASRLQLSEDPHIENLLARGEFFDPEQTDSFLCDHPQGMCHQGVCYELHHARESGDRLFTGMALSRGVWFRHSWIVNAKGGIVEPCQEMAEAYFGLALTDSDEQAFVSYWHGRQPNWTNITEEEKAAIRYLVNASAQSR